MRSRWVVSFVTLLAVLTVGGCTESEEPAALVPVTAIQRGALGFIDVRTSAVAPWCTAVLVAPDVVMTAARCVENMWPHQISFGVGSVTPTGAEGGMYLVGKIVLHPDRAAWQHDLAALVLEKPVTNVAPVAMGGETSDDGQLESVTYRFVRRGDASPRNFWTGQVQREGDTLTVTPTDKEPSCACVVGSGTVDGTGRLQGFVSVGTGRSPGHEGGPYCSGGFRVATVAHNQAFVQKAVALSAVPLVP